MARSGDVFRFAANWLHQADLQSRISDRAKKAVIRAPVSAAVSGVGNADNSISTPLPMLKATSTINGGLVAANRPVDIGVA